MGRERYLLQRDEAQSRRDIRESEERAARSRGGINLSRGIGRGLGTLLGIALAPATSLIPPLVPLSFKYLKSDL